MNTLFDGDLMWTYHVGVGVMFRDADLISISRRLGSRLVFRLGLGLALSVSSRFRRKHAAIFIFVMQINLLLLVVTYYMQIANEALFLSLVLPNTPHQLVS